MFLSLYCFLSTFASKFRADRKGVAALEYALMAALIGGVIAATVSTLGTTIKSTFSTITTSV